MTTGQTTASAVNAQSGCPLMPRPHTKAERLLDMLRTGTGASLEDMTSATGWQPHTVRAAMTGLRKRGFVIARHVEANPTVWSLAGGEPEIPA